MIIVVSDNGASGEGGPNGSVNEMKFANGVPDDLEQNLAMIDELGGTKTYNHYPNGWAMAFNTPFKMWKRYEFNGGTSDPCIIAWPAGTKARGEVLGSPGIYIRFLQQNQVRWRAAQKFEYPVQLLPAVDVPTDHPDRRSESAGIGC